MTLNPEKACLSSCRAAATSVEMEETVFSMPPLAMITFGLYMWGFMVSDTICEFCFELGGPRAHEGEAMTSPASCISSQMGLCPQLLEKPFIRSSKPDTCQPLLSIFRVCPRVCIQLEDTKTGTATSTSNSLAAADKNFSSLLPLLLLFLLLLNSKQEAQVLTQA